MSNFIDDYVAYANDVCYAPEIYHQTMARALVGMSCRNKVYFHFGDSKIFLNFWFILIGLSRLCHKSTSINDVGLAIMDQIDENHRFADQWSPEALIPFLSTKPSCTFYIDEFETFIEIMRKDYMGGGGGMLRTLYEVPPVWTKKLAKEIYQVKFPTMTIPCATTPTDFVECISEKIMKNGLMARFLTVYAKEKHKNASKLPPPVDVNKKNMIVQKLHDISDFAGVNFAPEILEEKPPLVYTFGNDVMPSYSSWVEKLDAEMIKKPMIMSSLSQLSVYLMKLSVVEAINESSTVITINHFNRALDFIEIVHKSITDLYENEMVFSDHAKERKEVIDRIKLFENGASLTDMKGLGIPKNKRDMILQELEEYGQVKVIPRRSPGACRDTTFYVYKENKI